MAAGARSRESPAGLTPPGGVSGKSLKGARSSAPRALQREPPRARLPSHPAPREVSAGRRPQSGSPWGRPPGGLRSPSPGPGCGWRAAPKFSEGLGGELERRSAGAGMARVAASWGRLGATFRGGASGRDTRARRTREPRPPRPERLARSGRGPSEPQPAGAATLLRAFLPARGPSQPSRPAVAPGHAGWSRSAVRQARPGPAAPAPRATPPGLSALRPSPSPPPAARYFHTSQCPGPGARFSS